MATNLNQLSQHKKLCLVIRTLRKFKQIKALTIAKALGYEDESAYCKIENGQTADISFWKLIIICKELNCSLFQVCYLADIELLLGNGLKTWEDFDQSLSMLNETDKNHLLELARSIEKKSL